jgi:cytosol aminopeptidase family protein
MELSFHPLTLEAIDSAAVESLCLFLASDERPLLGLAGLTDWRLSGRLSRLLRAGLLSGDAGEAVLTPPGARMGFQKLFLFGTGPTDQSEESLAARLAQALRKLTQAGVREAAMELPSRLAPEAGLRTLVAELQGPGRAVVFAAEPQKLAAALAQVLGGKPPVERPAAKPAPPSEPAPKSTPGPAQRYVPPPTKPHVFQKGKKKR